MWPSTPWNAKLKTVAPIKMNNTKQDSFMVESMACRMSFMSMRLRAMAMTKAPTAPIAPPSVGVAIPKKIVPSTRKISAKGGMRTKVTRSAMFDNKPILVALLNRAAKKATPTPMHMDTTMVSSRGVVSGNHLAKAIAMAKETPVKMVKDRRPEVPSSSLMVRASGGSAGTH